jgi:hypothetical protein
MPLPIQPRSACLVGAVAAALAVAADLALQYTGNAAHLGSKAYAYLLDVPPRRLLVGHFLGVGAILLEIVGFWGVARGLEAAGRLFEPLFLGIAAAAFAVGAAFHAMFAGIGLVLHHLAENGATPERLAGVAGAFRPAHEGLGAVPVFGMLLLSLVFSLAVVRGRSRFPRWMALASPLPVALALAALARAVPGLWLVVLPAGLNIANTILFLLAAITMRPAASTMRESPSGDLRHGAA